MVICLLMLIIYYIHCNVLAFFIGVCFLYIYCIMYGKVLWF